MRRLRKTSDEKRATKLASKKRYYEKHRDQILAKAKEYSKKKSHVVRSFVDNAKSGPCIDCGNKFPPCAMDFDHVRGQKLANIANMVRNKDDIEFIIEEIAKCDLVCANCHRIRTQNRRTGLIEDGQPRFIVL